MTLKDWIKQQGTGDTVKLRELANYKKPIAFNDWLEPVPRDPLTVNVEKELLTIMSIYGVSKKGTIGQGVAKITDEKQELIFRMNALFLGTLDVSGDDDLMRPHHDPVEWEPSPAEANGWGRVTGDEIERAIREP